MAQAKVDTQYKLVEKVVKEEVPVKTVTLTLTQEEAAALFTLTLDGVEWYDSDRTFGKAAEDVNDALYGVGVRGQRGLCVTLPDGPGTLPVWSAK